LKEEGAENRRLVRVEATIGKKIVQLLCAGILLMENVEALLGSKDKRVSPFGKLPKICQDLTKSDKR